MRPVLLSLCVGGLLLCGATRAADQADRDAKSPAPEPGCSPANNLPVAPPTPTTTPADARSLADAIAALTDKDQAKRQQAEKRLDAATEADIPALEKYTDSQESEVRRQVTRTLYRLQQCTLTLRLKFADGQPAAGVKGDFTVNELRAIGNPQDSLVAVNGNNLDPFIHKEVLREQRTTDAKGELTVRHLPEGKYEYLLYITTPLPAQLLTGSLTLESKATPVDLTVVHGVKATITVVDAAGQAVVGATVFDMGDRLAGGNCTVDDLKHADAQAVLKIVNLFPHATTDVKGVAVLEKLGAHKIDLGVFKAGCKVTVQEELKFTDNSPLALTVKLETAK